MQRLRKSRGSIRAATTKTIGLLGDLLLRDPLPATELRVLLRYFPAKAAGLQYIDKQILEAVGDREFENELTGAKEYKLNINCIETQAEYTLTSMFPSKQLDPLSATDGESVATPALQAIRQQCQLRSVALPKLQIPTFSADLRD